MAVDGAWLAANLTQSTSGNFGPVTTCVVGGFPGLILRILPGPDADVARPYQWQGANPEETHVLVRHRSGPWWVNFDTWPVPGAPVQVEQDRTDLLTVLASWKWRI